MVSLNKGKYNASKLTNGYKQTKVHTVFDVKYDGHHKAKYDEDGHLMKIGYSGW